MIDPFDEFKNPDGTYSGIKFMAIFSGLPEDEVKKYWAQAKYLKAAEDDRSTKENT